MQHLLLALSILLLTILANNKDRGAEAGKRAVVIKMKKPELRKPVTMMPGDGFSIYASRLEMLIN